MTESERSKVPPQEPQQNAPQQEGSVTSDILDEIDLLLEDDAEAFVKSYVQKGGQ